MREKRHRIRECRCDICKDPSGDGDVHELHRLLNLFMAIHDERGRRLFAGLVFRWNGGSTGKAKDGDAARRQEAKHAMTLAAAITGCDPRTIKRGLAELESPGLRPLEGRVREKGGGRPRRDRPDQGSGLDD